MAETPSVVGYASGGYSPAVYTDPNTNVSTSAGSFPLQSTGLKNETQPSVPVADKENAHTYEAAHLDSTKAMDNGPTGNGDVAGESGSLGSVENGNALDNMTSANAASTFTDGSALTAEEDRLWNIVRANSLDFNAWTALIDETEKVALDNISRIRMVYDTFLAEFPLCYGYWKKYADHEARVGAMDKVVEVYERAVQGVTYSVDIWLHYCIFAINTYGDPDTIRRLFERGLAYVGTDYLSSPLWEKYIEYESMQQEWGRLAMIYTRILENPIQNFDRYFNGFKELAETRPLSELRTAEEAAAAIATGATSVSSSTEVTESGSGDKANEGEVQADVATEQSSQPESAGITEAEELKKYIALREEMYKKAKEFESRICYFENAIKRPYYHVRPLNIAELENWHNYLDFIEKEGDNNKAMKLYERCLIACANYPEYWMRYVLYMENIGNMELAENALARATQVFVKRQPEIHLFAARFKEQNNDVAGARAAYQLVHSEISPGLLEAIMKHANMERRQGNLEDAFALYEQAIAIEKGKEHSPTLAMLYAQYSRFSYLVSGDAEKARKILVEALDHVQPAKPLLEALIHFETIQPLARRIDYLGSLVEKFVLPNSESSSVSTAAEREELSCIYLEFLGLFGDINSIKKAEDRHAKLFLPHRSTSDLKKRHAEDYLTADKAKMARNYAGTPPAQASMAAYPNAQNQWGSPYGAQPHTWPPVTQAAAQQWAPGYAQQAAYGAYGVYPGNYATPQAPTSVPQNTAYGAYPSTYPVQPYPQQNYAQPAAAPAVATPLNPAQPAASVPQAYYPSYY